MAPSQQVLVLFGTLSLHVRRSAWLLRVSLQAPAVWGALQILDIPVNLRHVAVVESRPTFFFTNCTQPRRRRLFGTVYLAEKLRQSKDVGQNGCAGVPGNHQFKVNALAKRVAFLLVGQFPPQEFETFNQQLCGKKELLKGGLQTRSVATDS